MTYEPAYDLPEPWRTRFGVGLRNDEFIPFSRCDLHPSGCHASNEKPRTLLLSAPIFVRARRWSLAPSRSMLQATNVSVRRKRKAERRKNADHVILCTLRCSARLARRARPSAFHHGSRQRESSSLRLTRARLRGDVVATGRVTPPTPHPVQRAPRAPVIVPAGLIPEPPGSGSDEPPPAGTASRSDQPGSPADVLHGERDWVPSIFCSNNCQTNFQTSARASSKSLLNNR